MAYCVSSKQIDRSREISSLVLNAAIDRVCGRISKREWDEIKFVGCFAECGPNFSPQAARELISPRLDELQFTSSNLDGTHAEVTYKARKPNCQRLAPTDKTGLSIEAFYSPVRMEYSEPRTLVVEWRNFFAVDTSAPLEAEIKRLKAYVDAGQMTEEQMISAVSDATSSLGVTLQ